MKDHAINIWNKVIDGYEGNSKYRWPDLIKDLEKIVAEYNTEMNDEMLVLTKERDRMKAAIEYVLRQEKKGYVSFCGLPKPLRALEDAIGSCEGTTNEDAKREVKL